LKEAHKTQEVAAIEVALTELNNAWQAASQDMYNTSQQDGGAQQQDGAAGGSNNNSADDVQDAEVVEEVK
jgi:molecular chaperone DnaK